MFLQESGHRDSLSACVRLPVAGACPSKSPLCFCRFRGEEDQVKEGEDEREEGALVKQ